MWRSRSSKTRALLELEHHVLDPAAEADPEQRLLLRSLLCPYAVSDARTGRWFPAQDFFGFRAEGLFLARPEARFFFASPDFFAPLPVSSLPPPPLAASASLLALAA